MEISVLSEMQELLSCGTNIPIWHYDPEGHLEYTNSDHLVMDKVLRFIGGISYMLAYGQQGRKPLVLGSDMGLMWCAVFAKEKDILRGVYLIGPVFNGEVSAAFMEESIERYHIDPLFRKQYLQTLRDISVVPSVVFFQYALMLHFRVTGEKLNRADIQFQPRSTIISPLVSDSADGGSYMQMYHSEQALLRILREGDMNYKQAVADSHHLFGQITEPHRQSILHAIIRATGFATLCIREAITAGISTDTAYAVGEGYIENMIQCRTVAELSSINLAMFEDFVFRVHRHRTNPAVSPQIQNCREYIELHAEQPIDLPLLARQVGYSPYYLSRKFKAEMGVSISSYIKYVRVERSKLMLGSTNVPIAQIAVTLQFASSSHFSESFKDVTGKTPQQYRAENQRF